MDELSSVINIGAVLEKQLNAVGIKTLDELKNTGSRDAWLKIRDMDPSACYNRLCSLEGAIQGIRWHNLSDETKNALTQFYRQWK